MLLSHIRRRSCVRAMNASAVWFAVVIGSALPCGAVLASINLELRGAPSESCGGQLVEIGLFAVSDDQSNQSMGGAEVILMWDASKLKLLGKVDNGPYPWIGSFFPNDSASDGLNAPFTGPAPFVPNNDGNALYAVFGQFAPNPPAEATPAGLLITTFRFQSLNPGAANLSVPSTFGEFTMTHITDGVQPGVEVTGELPSISFGVICPPAAANIGGSRRLAVTPSILCPEHVALRVLGDPLNATIECVDAYVQADGSLAAVPVFRSIAAWGTVIVYGQELLPDVDYAIEADCGEVGAASLAAHTVVTTAVFGDINESGYCDLDDVLGVLDAFGGDFSTVTLEDTDLAPCEPNLGIDLDDILTALDAFSGTPYDALCPAPCP